MGFVSSLYPVASFLFLRAAMRLLESWAIDGHVIQLVAGIACTALTIDAGMRLIATSMTSPYWWFTPLVVLGFGYVAWRAFRQAWKRLASPPPAAP